jgi:Mn-dependent DtxR family transcriptional regulator
VLIKVYRFRIQPNHEETYLAINRQANQIYERYLEFEQQTLRSKDDPGLIIEIHRYPDTEVYNKGIELINREPEIHRLYEQFLSILDPNDPSIEELECEEIFHWN